MSILVDSSVWIDYFRGSGDSGDTDDLDFLIDENLIVTNDLVLSEILPGLRLRRKWSLVKLLKDVSKHEMSIDWDDLIELQVTCLSNGINRVGVPDLIIAQHAIQNGLQLFSRDRHFRLVAEHLPLVLH